MAKSKFEVTLEKAIISLRILCHRHDPPRRMLQEGPRAFIPPLPHDEEQRRSFAYGNAKLSNESVTREMIDQAADALVKRK